MKLQNIIATLTTLVIAGSFNLVLAADPIAVKINPASTASDSKKKIVRTLTVTSKETDLSTLDESAFGWMQSGTTDKQDEVSTVSADCNTKRCVITVSIAADFSGKPDLHVNGQGKSASFEIKDQATVDQERTKANAAAALHNTTTLTQDLRAETDARIAADLKLAGDIKALEAKIADKADKADLDSLRENVAALTRALAAETDARKMDVAGVRTLANTANTNANAAATTAADAQKRATTAIEGVNKIYDVKVGTFNRGRIGDKVK